VTVARLLTFTAASALLVVVPGPSVLFIVGRAVAMGRAVAALTAVGTATGGWCWPPWSRSGWDRYWRARKSCC